MIGGGFNLSPRSSGVALTFLTNNKKQSPIHDQSQGANQSPLAMHPITGASNQEELMAIQFEATDQLEDLNVDAYLVGPDVVDDSTYNHTTDYITKTLTLTTIVNVLIPTS